MSLKSRRFIPLFGIAQSLVLAPALAALTSHVGRFAARRFPRLQRPFPWRWVLPAVALGLGAWWLVPYPLSSRAFLYLTSQDSFPVEALNVAEANKLGGKVFAFYEWGGYVDLRTSGALQVFIDGRADTVFSDQTYRRYTRVLNLAPGWEKIIEDSGADYVLWPKGHHQQIEILRDSGKWRTLYADHVAALLMKANQSRPEPWLPSPDSAWRELALDGAPPHPRIFPRPRSTFSTRSTSCPTCARRASGWPMFRQEANGWPKLRRPSTDVKSSFPIQHDAKTWPPCFTTVTKRPPNVTATTRRA
jgi:hypothetical protein